MCRMVEMVAEMKTLQKIVGKTVRPCPQREHPRTMRSGRCRQVGQAKRVALAGPRIENGCWQSGSSCTKRQIPRHLSSRSPVSKMGRLVAVVFTRSRLINLTNLPKDLQKDRRRRERKIIPSLFEPGCSDFMPSYDFMPQSNLCRFIIKSQMANVTMSICMIFRHRKKDPGNDKG